MKLFGKRKPTRPPVRHILPPLGEQRPPVDVPQVPAGMWEKCVQCNNILYADDLQARLMTCPQCGYHFRLTARVRIELTADSGSFAELDADLTGHNPLDFPGYEDKLKTARAFTGLKDAVVTGTARISGQACVLAVMDGHFMMGSMGAAVGEKLTRAAEVATEKKLPLIAFTVSGGARMQEGMISLMQMARVSGAILTHSQAGLLYVVVLTDPTTGGVTASFAMQGDIILAEPGALIGFAGRRVIEQTTRSILPDGFQRAEFLMEKGFVDQIVPRAQMAQTLGRILLLHQKEVGT